MHERVFYEGLLVGEIAGRSLDGSPPKPCRRRPTGRGYQGGGRCTRRQALANPSVRSCTTSRRGVDHLLSRPGRGRAKSFWIGRGAAGHTSYGAEGMR